MPEAPSSSFYDSPDDSFAAREIEMPMGIVVEKRPAVSRWITHVWKPVAVLPGAHPLSEWKLLIDDGSVQTYHIATLPLTLHRKETEAYLVNLANETPAFCGMRMSMMIPMDLRFMPLPPPHPPMPRKILPTVRRIRSRPCQCPMV